MAIKILIAEDQSLILGALAALLSLERDFEVVGKAADGRQALEQVKALKPDIVLTDIEMPHMTGLDLTQEMRALSMPARIIILTTFSRSGYLRRALDAGVAGYLLKDAPAESLAQAIRKVYAGGRVVAPELAMDAWSEADMLTERERQVLRLAAEGKTSADIAKSIHLSEGTVRNYLSEAISKLGAANRIEAARIAQERGWL